MHEDGEAGPKSVRELAAAVGFRAAKIQSQTGGLGQLEKRLRQAGANRRETVGLRKPLPQVTDDHAQYQPHCHRSSV